MIPNNRNFKSPGVARNVGVAAQGTALVMGLKVLHFINKHSRDNFLVKAQSPKTCEKDSWAEIVAKLARLPGIVPDDYSSDAAIIVTNAVSKYCRGILFLITMTFTSRRYFETRFCWHCPRLDFFHYAVCDRMASLRLSGRVKVTAGLAALYGFETAALDLTLPKRLIGSGDAYEHLLGLDHVHFLRVNKVSQSESGIKNGTAAEKTFLARGPANSVRAGICVPALAKKGADDQGRYYFGFALWFAAARKLIGDLKDEGFEDIVEVLALLNLQVCVHAVSTTGGGGDT